MHTGFFNLYKPREYKFRHIYYDPKKEAAKEREQRLADEAHDGLKIALLVAKGQGHQGI